LLRHPLVFNQARVSFAYDELKPRLADAIRRARPERAGRMLIAPIGWGHDVPFLSEFAAEIHGVDLSAEALARCPPGPVLKLGDILDMDYPDGFFDIVAAPQFFHHVESVGFDPFLLALRRVLKPGGLFVAVEPSLWYPLNAALRPLKRLLGNPFGEVEDEGPFDPQKLIHALDHCGFHRIHADAATFSHPSLPIPLQRFISRATRPLLTAPVLRFCAWQIVYRAERPL
jgi:SAM-dependent methyltransferase